MLCCFLRRSAGARFILVVEKDAVFQSLVESRLHQQLPCIIITGGRIPFFVQSVTGLSADASTLKNSGNSSCHAYSSQVGADVVMCLDSDACTCNNHQNGGNSSFHAYSSQVGADSVEWHAPVTQLAPAANMLADAQHR